MTAVRAALAMLAPDLACPIDGTPVALHPSPAARASIDRRRESPTPPALVDCDHLRIRLYAKPKNLVEVRFWQRLPNGQWHRTGTNCIARDIWLRVWRPLFEAGSAATGVRCEIEPTPPPYHQPNHSPSLAREAR